MVDDGEGLEQFVVDAGGKLFGVDDFGRVDGLAVALILAVLHVHEADVVAFVELGVATTVAVDGDGLFEEVLVVVGKGEDTTIALTGDDWDVL